MQDWIKRFSLLAVVGALLSGAVLAGCGGGDDEDDAAVGAQNEDVDD